MTGTGIMAGIYSSPSPYPYPIEKIGDSPYPYPVNAGILRGRVRAIPTGTSLFAISRVLLSLQFHAQNKFGKKKV